jgi:purine-binding chemotaxis protein CheW
MPGDEAEKSLKHWLLCRAGSRLCALPLDCVVETLRPLPVEPIAGAPPFVLGLSIWRGAPVPVLDAGLLFGEAPVQAARLVAIRAKDRTVAIAFSGVAGLRAIDAEAAGALPPLLREAAAEAISAISTLDAELLIVLNAARVAPDDLLESLDAMQAAS